jgi:hypothetical protein
MQAQKDVISITMHARNGGCSNIGVEGDSKVFIKVLKAMLGSMAFSYFL